MPEDDPTAALALLRSQRDAFSREGIASAAVRVERLDRALSLLVSNQEKICAAVAADFGQRPAQLTRLMDIFPAVHALKFARRNLRRWMRPQRRRLSLPIGVPGTRGKIIYQPLGVVGVISPWNFPVTLTFGPLAGILAAGNRCMIKPSEVTPATSELMRQLIERHFEATEVSVVTGGAEVAESFSQMPFDHLLFTGSAAVGRRVMAAAAQNLVPVTLELGGKCPVVIGRSADLRRAVDRIWTGKLANAGQICLAPDYVLIRPESVDPFQRNSQEWIHRAYPAVSSNPDYTSVVSDRHMTRIRDLLADARAKGAKIVSLADDPQTGAVAPRFVAPTLIIGATDEMRIMQEEIFAPLLPVRTYQRFDEVISAINRREPPLALYYFGRDSAEEGELLGGTRSGGVTLNDVAMHFLAEELPFGGVGASGMGAYHGEYGFQRFSHARAIFRQTGLDVSGLLGLRPPYGARLRSSLRFLIRR
jgi:coniferyl-aldehyde dehydrogenase